MPASVERLTGEAILIARYTEKVTVADVRFVFQRSVDLMTPEDQVVFRITDMLHSNSEFTEVLKMARELGSGVPGSTTDPRIKAAIVGKGKWAKLFADTIKQKQFGGFQLPFFKDMASALAYVRLELSRMNDTSIEKLNRS